MAKQSKRIKHQKEKKEKFVEIEEAGQQLQMPSYGFGYSKERAKADLEMRIAEKLSHMSERDMEELFELHEKQRLAEKAERHYKQEEEPEEPLDGQQFMDLPESYEEPEEDETLNARVEEFFKGYDAFEEEEEAEVAEEKPFPDMLREKWGRAGAKGRMAVQNLLRLTTEGAGSLKTKLQLPSENLKKEKRRRKAKTLFVYTKRRFSRKEKKAAESMAELISRMDRRNNRLAKKTLRIYIKSNRRFNFAREWAETHKKKLIISLTLAVTILISAAAVVSTLTAYEYAYNGRVLGMVKNQDNVLRILEIVSEQLTREYGTQINIDKDQDITFQRVVSINKEIDDMEDVLNRLTYMQDMNAKAYALYIDGKRIAILDTKERSEGLLQKVKDLYTQQPQNINVDYESVNFAEATEIKQIDTQLGKIQNADDVMNKILTGAVEQKVHIVKKGETFSGIAKIYGMTQAELEVSNPGINPAKLNIDQQIILTQAAPLLTVQTVEVATYIEPIPYTTTNEENASIFKGEKTTKVSGANGERQVTARIVRNNGLEVGKVELSSTILKEPVTAVVSIGTKDPPPLQGTGHFINPCPAGRISSKFGMRNGRMHNGLDMACKTGNRISAADGGTVTFAGYNGSLGYMVKINHGGGKETLYGHCSKLFVKKGEKVYQGQHIANVGNTGRSTGPHCHFEVHVNGSPKNPQNYI